MKRMKRLMGVGLLVLGLAVAGCATTSATSNAIDADSVKVSKLERTGCKHVGDLTVTCRSKQEVKAAVQEKASSLGANYVQLKSLTVGTVTGQYKVRGIALLCLR